MNILINLDTMSVLHKHPDGGTLCNIAWIECQLAAYAVVNCDDSSFLRHFTDTELKLLYRSTTGENGTVTFSRSQLMQIIVDLCFRLPQTNALAWEADMQAKKVPEGSTKKWLYVKGATLPGIKSDLFEHAVKTAKRSPDNERLAVEGKLPALKQTVTPRSTPTPTPGAKVAPRAEPSVKRGTAKIIIWRVADDAWEAAGKPTDKKEVLALRRQIMDTLEATENVKRTSASSELGNWHKTRAPF